MGMDTWQEQWRKREAEALAKCKEDFEHVRDALKLAGVTHVSADYSGYGDAYNGIEVVFSQNGRAHPVTDVLQEMVSTFLDDVMEARHSGFWNNEGGNGQFSWDINGVFEHVHNDAVTEYETTTHEDFQ